MLKDHNNSHGRGISDRTANSSKGIQRPATVPVPHLSSPFSLISCNIEELDRFSHSVNATNMLFFLFQKDIFVTTRSPVSKILDKRLKLWINLTLQHLSHLIIMQMISEKKMFCHDMIGE